jgi:S1-C subfamily serine protease
MWVTIGSGEGEGLSVRVEGDRFLVGSGEECQLLVRGGDVKPLHAFFQVRQDGVVELHPLEGATYVNGHLIEGPAHITGGEEIRIGDTMLRPSVDDPAEEARALVEPEGQDLGEPEPVVRVQTEGEPLEVVPARERRRLLDTTRRATRLAIGALVLGVGALLAVLLLTGDDEKSVAEIVDDAKSRTVLIAAETEANEGSGGSGVVLDAEEGYVLTNFHVVNRATNIEVGVDEDSRTAELVAAAPCDDLALLKVDDTDGMETIELASQDDVKQGDEVVALGYPRNASLQDELTSTAGTVSVVKSSFNLPDPTAPSLSNVVQIDVALSPGNSGGPLVNKAGKLVGINTAIFAQAQGAATQGYAIGVDRVKEVAEDLREERSQGWAGLALVVPKESELEKANLPSGIVAGQPQPGSDAEAQRLAEVLITEIDGNQVTADMASYCRAVDDVESGESVPVTVIDAPSTSKRARERRIQLKFE